MAKPKKGEFLRYSVSLVTQGRHRFYTLTVPSDILAKSCFVTTRDEDPEKGFQRVLDKKRAEEIANYIDNEFGTIPNSIILSAQSDAELKIVGRGKTLEFKFNPKAFLILDGQHRVYGFSLARTALRVPVVIYNELSRRDESRLFIDINTKQRPVPSELLLDIKKLAEYESNNEQICREIFDLFQNQNDSPLLGLLTPSKKVQNKVSRTTFYSAVMLLLPIFSNLESNEIYEALRSFFQAFLSGIENINAGKSITNPIVFRASLVLFKEAARRVKDRHGPNYNSDNFFEILEPIFGRISISKLKNPGRSIKELSSHFSKALETDFTL